MRKIIAAINMTIDGFCDHTAVIADEALHQHYNELFKEAGAVLFGRKTYQLMEDSWPQMVKHPSGEKAMDEFAVLIDNIPKIVVSHSLKEVRWKNSRLAKGSLTEETIKLKEENGAPLLVSGPSIIAELTQLGLIDEYQLCVHPIILGQGLVLFKGLHKRIDLQLQKTKTLDSGAVILYYAQKNLF